MSHNRSSRLIAALSVLAVLAAGWWLLFRGHAPAAEAPGRVRLLMSSGQGALPEAQYPPAPAAEPEPALPSVISLADLPPAEPNPANMYLSWQRGELDLDREFALIGEVEERALQEAALRLPPAEGLVDISEESSATGPTLLHSFDGPDITDCCTSGAAVPPDPILAVGPQHLIVAVNESFTIYNRSGATIIGPLPFATLFSGVTGCSTGAALFDPNVLYDEEAGRYMLAIDGGGTYYCLAVSQSPDPTGVWIRYRFATGGGGLFFDFPQAGVGDDAIYLGGNMFNTSGLFVESRVWAFDKTAMYAAQSAQWRVHALPASEDTPQPVSLRGYAQGQWPAGAPHAIITETNFNGRDYSLYRWSEPFGSNQVAKVNTFNLNVATGMTAGFPVNVPQPNGSTLRANDWRPLDAEYHNGTVWTTNTVSCNPGGGTVNCVRWAQVSATTGAVLQAGVVAGSGRYRFFGDLAVNSCGDMAIGYTRVDPANPSTGYPSVWVAGRRAADPPGVLSAEQPVRQSSTAYTAFDPAPRRWGDYTAFTADPNGLDLWYVGQYSRLTGTTNGRWATVVGHFTFGGAAAAAGAFGLNYELFLPLIIGGSGGSGC